jgi:hypothetical protein
VVRPDARRAHGGTAGSTARLLWELAGRLTQRDRVICRLLLEHRCLTTRQVTDVGFTQVRKAQERLAVLFSFDVVERFRPLSWAGTGPYHFTLGPVGAAVVAAERGVEVADLAWPRGAASVLARSEHLGHLVGVNGFFTALVRSARQRTDATLATWWSERRCAAAWGEVVRPDGYGVWAEGGARLPFLLEYDNGTERLARLADKLPGYARLAGAAGYPTWVLFRFPSASREAGARRALAQADVPVATAVLAPGAAPDGAVWLAVGDSGPRLPLAGLGHPGARPGTRRP